MIFSGDIRFTVTGKDNLVDSWILVQACDSEEAFVSAFVSTTIQKVYTTEDVYNLLMTSLEPYGIGRGITPVFHQRYFLAGELSLVTCITILMR
jgi:hypothetical protein